MEEELKSAWEIALEKAAGLNTDVSAPKLSPEQREKISNIEKEHQIKIAEKEIMLQAKLKKLASEYSPAELQQQAMVLSQNFVQEKNSLEEEKGQKIELIKRGEA